MITGFTIFKNEDKQNPNQPDYRLSANIGGEFVTIGGGWKKEGIKKDGVTKYTYISVGLQEPHGKYKGYELVEYTETPVNPPTEENTSRHAAFLNDVPTIQTPDF